MMKKKIIISNDHIAYWFGGLNLATIGYSEVPKEEELINNLNTLCNEYTDNMLIEISKEISPTN